MQKTILVIDDEPAHCDVMKHFLTLKGYRVMTAGSGSEGIQSANQLPPDLIFLDVKMPGMDGFEVLFELKKNPKTSSVPVVMLSAKDDTSAIMKSQEMRAVDYMAKPIEEKEMISLVEKYVR